LSKLFVDEIQPKTTGSNVSFTETPLTPQRPAFRVRKTSAQTATGIQQLVTWDTAELNVGGHFANNIFTAPVAGVYHFSLIALTPNDSDIHIYRFLYQPSGGSLSTLVYYYSTNSSNHETVSGSFIHQMGVGDTLGLYLDNTNDVIYGDSGEWTHWSGYLIG